MFMGQRDATKRLSRNAAAALKLQPTWIGLYLLRANILRERGKLNDAAAEAAAVAAASPDSGYAHVIAANIYSALQKDAEAMAAFTRAIAIKPEAYIYLNRGLRRHKADVSGRQADLDAALELGGDFVDAIAAKADLYAEIGDLAGAISVYSSALERWSDHPTFSLGRGIAFARSLASARSDQSPGAELKLNYLKGHHPSAEPSHAGADERPLGRRSVL